MYGPKEPLTPTDVAVIAAWRKAGIEIPAPQASDEAFEHARRLLCEAFERYEDGGLQ